MIVQAFMPVHNELDVLPHVLAHLLLQGIQVHILDGWSTDGSYEYARSMAGVTVERFPEGRDDGIWNCTRTLERIEKLAARSYAAWCMLTDADEWRRPRRAGETLVQGIKRADAEGWNVIDHRVLAFFCTDDSWTGTTSPEHHFRYYNTNDLICTLPQEKIWKNTRERVDLHTSGGHQVILPAGQSKRVSPERFIMKHYPFRTPSQAKAKIETRLARRCEEEHNKGWGVHYDLFKPGFEYCWDKEKLMEWNLEAELGTQA